MQNRNRKTYGDIFSSERLERKELRFEEKRSNNNEKTPSVSWPIRLVLRLIVIPYLLLRGIWRFLDKRSGKTGVMGLLLKLGVYAGIFGFIAFVLLFLWSGHKVRGIDPDDLIGGRNVHQSTKIYDKSGEHILYEIFSEEKRTVVNYEQLPEDLIHAIIATEDSKFYEHKGVRPLSIIRSVVLGALGQGRIGGGASTLTQQLVKNAILTNERTITRKAKEIVLAYQIERIFTKEQILRMYFNEIGYGSTNYGVESAAQSYFDKSVSELNLQEAATLAGFPKAPSRYLNNHEALKERRNFVLRRMHEEGYITEEERDAAQESELEIQNNYQNIDAPHFSLYVREKLVDMFGETKVTTGGLRVYTTLDWDKQQAAEKVINENAGSILDEAEANNVSLVAMDPKTSQILAMIGSRDFFDKEIDGQFNVATLGKRQPGSSFKPIIYAAAFEKGYTPETVVFDVITNFAISGKPYVPKNYDLQEHGPVSFRQALQGSLNIPAVKALYLVGAVKGVEFAQRLGYTTLTDPDRFGLSLVLGGGEVYPLEHVNAYSIFANGGTRREPVAILKVEDANGEILHEWKEKKGDRVIEEGLANLMSNILSDDPSRAYAFGAGGVLTLPGRPVAVKTGTTNNYVDAWTVGYTPEIVAGVWAGNTDNTPMKRGFGGSRVAAPIWNAFMREALKDTPVSSFPAPPENNATKAALRGGAGGGITLKVDKVTGKLATSSTPERFIVERTYTQPHSILHYTDKNNPRGDIPTNPGNDEQYFVWEASIQDWIRRRKEEDPEWELSFEEPPTEYDDIHDLALIPSLEVVFPAPSSTIFSRRLDTDIRVSAPRGVKSVTYRLNGTYIGVIREHPFNLNKDLPEMRKGQNELTIFVEDDVGNRLEETIYFNLEADAVKPSARWSSSEISLTPEESQLPIFIDFIQKEKISSVKVVAQKGSETITIHDGEITNLVGGRMAIDVSNLDKGTWSLSAEAQSEDGSSLTTLQLSIN